MSPKHTQRPLEQFRQEFEKTFGAWVLDESVEKLPGYPNACADGAWMAWQCQQARIDELQAILDWMKANNDWVYHFIGASGDGFIDRVRAAMSEEPTKEPEA